MAENTEKRVKRHPQNHRTVDRVTAILEEVVYRPGITLTELASFLDAAKSSVHGFVSGLLARGWLHESNGGFFLGPAVYGLTIASGHIRAGFVSQDDLNALSKQVGFAVFLGVAAGDNLIYISESGSDDSTGFEARNNIRRLLLSTAGGKAILAATPSFERDVFLRRQSKEVIGMVEQFLLELDSIKQTSIAINHNERTNRFGIATVLHDPRKNFLASVTVVGPADKVKPKVKTISKALISSVNAWVSRSNIAPREEI